MTIRQFAKSCGFEVVGKLKRRAEWEYDVDYRSQTGEYRRDKNIRAYMDEDGNEYYRAKHKGGRIGFCIVTKNGNVL